MDKEAKRNNFCYLLKSLVFLFSYTNLFFFLLTISTDNTTETPVYFRGGKVSLTFVHIIL